MSKNERIKRLERRLVPVEGMLPVVVAVPAENPERAQVLADIERRRARGENVLTIEDGQDSMAAMVELFAP